MKLDELYFHDGLIRSLSFRFNEEGLGIVEIVVDLYTSYEAPNRKAFELVFIGVSSYSSNVDVTELIDNKTAGNIANCRSINSTFWLYLVDGSVNIEYENVAISEY